MAAKFSIKKAGGFQLGSGSTDSPAFSGDGRILAVCASGTSRVTVWDVESKSQISCCRFSLKHPHGISLNYDGSRIAMRSDGLLEVMDTRTAERIRLIKKNNYAEGYGQQLSAEGNLLFEASDGIEAGFMVWDVETGDCLERHPFNGEDYMVTAISRSEHDDVAVCWMAKAKPAEEGMRDVLWLWSVGHLQQIGLELTNCTVAISPDGQQVFVAGMHQRGGEAIFRLLDRSGKILVERMVGNERTFPVSQPVWRPDGRLIAWEGDSLSYQAMLLNPVTLETANTLFWPDLSVAFGQNDWIALAGDKGVVLPSPAIKQAVEEIGKPGVEIARHKSHAYSQAILLRKVSPRRVAVFQQEDSLRIEVEELVGSFMYLPLEGGALIRSTDDAESIGQAVHEALQRFRLRIPTRSPIEWDWFETAWATGELSQQLRERNVRYFCELSEQESQQVRLLGTRWNSRPGNSAGFTNPAVAPDSRYLFLTYHANLFELWPGETTANGEFCERDWPHIPLADTVSDEELGVAVLAGLQQSKLKTSRVKT